MDPLADPPLQSRKNVGCGESSNRTKCAIPPHLARFKTLTRIRAGSEIVRCSQLCMSIPPKKVDWREQKVRTLRRHSFYSLLPREGETHPSRIRALHTPPSMQTNPNSSSTHSSRSDKYPHPSSHTSSLQPATSPPRESPSPSCGSSNHRAYKPQLE